MVGVADLLQLLTEKLESTDQNATGVSQYLEGMKIDAKALKDRVSALQDECKQFNDKVCSTLLVEQTHSHILV